MPLRPARSPTSVPPSTRLVTPNPQRSSLSSSPPSTKRPTWVRPWTRSRRCRGTATQPLQRRHRHDRRRQQQRGPDRCRRPENGVRVVHEPVQGIARARNAGARHAEGDVLVFIDADVDVPHDLLQEIHAAMSDPDCIGGGVDVDYRPRRLAVRLYLRAWRVLGRLAGMVQGAAQFCRSPSSKRSEGTTRRCGSARTSTSTGASRGSQRGQVARSGSYGIRECVHRAAASTSGLYGRPWSGPTLSSSGCSAAGKRPGRTGTRAPCVRPRHSPTFCLPRMSSLKESPLTGYE